MEEDNVQDIILIAPPAAGKGTQSKLLSTKYQIPHISTGDLLRAATNSDSELGKTIKDFIANGKLVTDEIVLELLEDRITKDDCKNGYILDGFPRNIKQADAYLNLLNKLNRNLGNVIYLDVPFEVTKNRILGRLSCPVCGAVYNDKIEENKPKVEGICDVCNNKLVKRSDDTEETFNKRYETYKKETYPLIEYFEKKGKLFKIDSMKSKEEVLSEIEKIMGYYK